MRWFRRNARLRSSILELEARVDSLTDALADQGDRPTTHDVTAVRSQSDKVAAELARLEVNLAARLDAVREDIRSLSGESAVVIDLRRLSPTDTGWSLPAG